jgi:hypothetical protein
MARKYALNRKAVQLGQFADIEATSRARPLGPLGYVEINSERQPVYAGPDTGSLIYLGLDLCSELPGKTGTRCLNGLTFQLGWP